MQPEANTIRSDAPGARLLIVCASYYRAITDSLLAGAARAIEAAGASYELIETPGAFEIPQAIAHAARLQPNSYEGYLALGCVIRGETNHYEYVCAESARALMDLAVRDGLAIGYGILTVDSIRQAQVRSAPDRNKGEEAARACLSLIALKRQFSGPRE